jgi:hypothetical protein
VGHQRSLSQERDIDKSRGETEARMIKEIDMKFVPENQDAVVLILGTKEHDVKGINKKRRNVEEYCNRKREKDIG